MSRKSVLRGACLALFAAMPVWSGQNAHLGNEGAVIADEGEAVVVTIPMNRTVPWRAFLAEDPPRLVVEFSELDWSRPPRIATAAILGVTTDRHAPGQSRMVAKLAEPLDIVTAEMRTGPGEGVLVQVRLMPTTPDAFRDAARTEAAPAAGAADLAGGRLVVAIDPGHGGVDPGAEAAGLNEADLMLAFARELQRALAGTFDTVLTRDADVFVSLEERLTRARAAGADVFLSLHADALEKDAGRASGMTVYTFDADAGQAAGERFAARHSGADIISGVDLSGAGDDVSLVLMDLARRDTLPRAAGLSGALAGALRAAGLRLNSRPERSADLAVLRSAEMPSVLLELGFLSSASDLAALTSDAWQAEAARAVRDGLMLWADEDRLREEVFRR